MLSIHPPSRLLVLMLIAAASLAALAFATRPAVAGTGRSTTLTPDLKVLPLGDVYIRKTPDSKDLRFDTVIGNRGRGVVELYPQADDCNSDGDVTNDRSAHEVLFRDTNASGAFERGVDEALQGQRVGCMIFHPAHQHWHFEQFALYELSRPATGRLVAEARKVSFCVRDTIQAFTSRPGSPTSLYYGNCTQDSTMGLSVGWADVYDATLVGQEIDIRGLHNGLYCLSMMADPRDLLTESREENNATRTLLRIRDARVRIVDDTC